MILVSTMEFSDIPDIMVLPEIILDITLWVKSKMASISARLSYKLTSFLTEWTQKHNFGSTIGFSSMPEIVVWLGNSLAISLWVKSKMADNCESQKII